MKKITLLLIALSFALFSNAQYVFNSIAGPTNVAAGSPTTINLNDIANGVGVSASSTGSYSSFSITLDWAEGAGGPWSSEADITFTTTAGSVAIDPPTNGGNNDGNDTVLTFEGDLAGPYDPSVDGFIDLILNQSFGGSDANWSNIVITLFESPTCIAPSDMVASNGTTTSVDLSWTIGDTETIWDIEYNGGADFTPGNGEEEGSVNVSGTPTTSLSGLTEFLEYFVYYRSDCGATDGSSEWIGPFNFTTIAGATCASAIPMTVELNCSTATPTSFDFSISEDIDAAGENPTCDGFGNFGYWVSFTAPAMGSVLFNFGGAADAVGLEVLDTCGGTSLGCFNNDFNAGDTSDLITGLTPGNTYVAVIWRDTQSGTADVCIESPTCIFPTDLTATNFTEDSAQLGWTENGSATLWNIEIVIAGDTPTGTATATGVSNPYTATGLMPNTDYEFYVQADCGGGDTSNFTGPLLFTTDCASFIPDYIEQFNTIIPDCWDEADSGDATTGPMELGDNFAWVEDGFLNDGGTGAYKINLWVANKSDWLLSPSFDLTGGPFQVEFDFGIMEFGSSTVAGTLGSDDTVQLLITNDNGVTWTTLLTYDNTSVVPATGETPVVTLEAYAGQTVQFGILGSEGTVDDTEDNDVFVDNFRVRGIPTCPEPSDLTSTNLSLTSTELGWTETGTSTLWNIEYGLAGYTPGTGTIVTGVTNPYILTGLTSDTDYDFYVQAVCDPTNLSSFEGPFTFFTGYCQSLPTSNDGNGVTNVTIGVTDFPSLGDVTYENQTTPVVDVFQGINTSVDITFATGFTYNANIWIDFNDDLIFDDTELVFQGESTNDNPTILDASFLMPLTAPLGQHRMRIGTADNGQANPDPCYSGSFGVTLDFTVDIQQLTCTLPDATFTTNVDCPNDQFFIDVDITSLGDATSLEISNNFDTNTLQATAIGMYQAGPFPYGNAVKIFVTNEQNNSCIIDSDSFTILTCPPDNDECDNATVAVVNTDDNCDLTTPGTIFGATPSGIDPGTCDGDPNDDVWFVFTATNNRHIITLENISGNFVADNLDYAVYEGACDNLIELYCSDVTATLTPDLVIGSAYYIRVFSAGSSVNEDTTFELCIRPGRDNVIVDQTTFTVEQLVEDILIGGECAQISNITFSTGTNFGEINGIGYFSLDGNGEGFPFEEGIIMTSGDAALASGPNTETLSDGTTAWLGDPDLDIEVGITSNNATIIEFDFVPLAQEISFDFLMASEEYNGNTGGTFECTFSDAFAFLLTDQNDDTTNLAVLPGTTTPILVTNIHLENPGCPAINEQYFGGYTEQNLPSTSFDGRTEVFTAQADVNVGETYHIKLVIADAGDAAFDSGVFLKAGSFDLGELNLGDDITIASGEADCFGSPILLDTQAPNLEHVWFRDGFVIPGETSSTLLVTEPDLYTAQVIFSNQCFLQDDIVVEFLELPIANQPQNLVGCSVDGVTLFSLIDQDAEILGSQNPNDFTITYHETEQNAEDNVAPLVSPYQNTSNPQTIYARVENNTTGCFSTTSFDLVFGLLPITSFPEDFDYEVCPNATVPIQITAIAENYSINDVSIAWYLDGGLISGQTALTLPVTIAGTYSVEITFNDTGCFDTTDIDVIELENCIIPQAISPGVTDGQNDRFEASHLDVVKLEIFNRNGTLVYSKKNYTNEWFGQTNDGKELPVGTYFYTMIYEGGAKQRSSWIYVNR